MMASTSKSYGSVRDVLESWDLAHLWDAFERAEIDLTCLSKIDETTARGFLSPGSFMHFWEIYQERKGELANASRKRKSAPVVQSEDSDNLEGDESSDDENNDDVPVSEHVVEEVRKLLNSTFIGETLLATNFEDRTDTDRCRIAEIVVTEELRRTKPVGHIQRKRLIALSKALAFIFDDEDERTFYSPYRTVNNAVYTAKGKLTIQYYFWRAKGVKANLLHSLRSNTKTKRLRTVSLTGALADSVKWLNVNLGPIDLVEDHWKRTFRHRMDLLDIRRNDKISIPQYYSMFPVLRQPEAVLLFKLDYDTLYKNTANNLELNFKVFAEKQLAKLRKIKDFHTPWLNSLSEYLALDSGASLCHHFFSCLSQLFPVQVVVKGRKPNNWTANKAEMQKSFLLHVASESLLESAIEARVARLSSFKKPLSFSPFPAIVGKDLKSIEKSYVIIQPTERYVVNSPFEAIDTTFKAIHALCVEYPPDCRNMWLLIQQKVYKVYTECDDVPPQIIPIMKFFS